MSAKRVRDYVVGVPEQQPVTVDTTLAAVLDQVLVGLLPPDALPTASVFLDEEGTPIARSEAGAIVATKPLRWQRPSDVRSDGPIVVAVAGRVPAVALPPGSTVLLPAGGVRPDDGRWPAWAAAWSRGAAATVKVPVPPTEAAGRADALAAAYGTGSLVDVETAVQPAGVGRTVFF